MVNSLSNSLHFSNNEAKAQICGEFANHQQYTRQCEQSVLAEMVCDHRCVLDEPSVCDVTVGLVQPRPANRRTNAALLEILGFSDADVLVNPRSRFNAYEI